MTDTPMTTDRRWMAALVRLHTCHEAVEWAEAQPSFEHLWATCERGDWLMWLVPRVMDGEPESPERKRIVAVAVACARLALPIYEARYPQDRRVLDCLDTTERWTRGEATLEKLREARNAASSAAVAAYAADSASSASYAASSASVYAASAASAASYAASDASSASYAASDASYAAYAAYAAKAQTLRACADIVRQHFTAGEVQAALNASGGTP